MIVAAILSVSVRNISSIASVPSISNKSISIDSPGFPQCTSINAISANAEIAKPTETAAVTDIILARYNLTFETFYYKIYTAFVQFLDNSLERLVVFPFLVRNILYFWLAYFHSNAPFRQAYARPNTSTSRKKPMLTTAIAPYFCTTTAHG